MASNPATIRKLATLLESQDCRCFYCGEGCALEEATLDHIVPKSRGGSKKNSNLVVAHYTCNTILADLCTMDDLRGFCERIEPLLVIKEAEIGRRKLKYEIKLFK